MERNGSQEGLRFVESVRCLECGAVYAKPAGGGTVYANPGCPECGYVGWVPVSQVSGFARSGADRQLRPVDRTG